MKYTASLEQLHISERLKNSRKEALESGIPVADDETLNFLLTLLSAIQPKKILEIGTAVGLSAIAMAQTLSESKIRRLNLKRSAT